MTIGNEQTNCTHKSVDIDEGFFLEDKKAKKRAAEVT